MEPLIKIKTSPRADTSASILIIYTGGTVGMAYDKAGTLLQPFNFQHILDKIPELRRLEAELTFVSVKQPMDSANFQPGEWIEIGEIIFNNYNFFDGFVILHGTDTMAYSATALSFLLENLNKPVVLTGAQLPIGVARTDARENFITSLEIACAKHADGTALIKEVCIYFDYNLLRGNRSKKVQSNSFNAFDSPNYPVLAEAGVNIEYNFAAINIGSPSLPLKLSPYFDEHIAALKIYPGILPENINSILSIKGLKGLILETYGAGNGPVDTWFFNALKTATENGIVILNVTQCLGGKVTQGKYETSLFFKEAGVISGGNITFEAAVVKMMFVLAHPEYSKDTRTYLARPMRGEMDEDLQ